MPLKLDFINQIEIRERMELSRVETIRDILFQIGLIDSFKRERVATINKVTTKIAMAIEEVPTSIIIDFSVKSRLSRMESLVQRLLVLGIVQGSFFDLDPRLRQVYF